MEFNTILLIVAIVLLAASLLVKGYGMMQLANKDLPQEERMARYKKTMPLTYLLSAAVTEEKARKNRRLRARSMRRRILIWKIPAPTTIW